MKKYIIPTVEIVEVTSVQPLLTASLTIGGNFSGEPVLSPELDMPLVPGGLQNQLGLPGFVFE